MCVLIPNAGRESFQPFSHPFVFLLFAFWFKYSTYIYMVIHTTYCGACLLNALLATSSSSFRDFCFSIIVFIYIYYFLLFLS